MKSIPILLVLAIIFCPAAAAAAKSPSTDKAKAIKAGSNNKKMDYQTWLRQYGAYDVLQRSLADNSASPEALLERSKAFLEMNDAGSVLELLGARKPFKDKSQEAERLLLVARSHRLLGDMSGALRAYSQACEALGRNGMSKILLVEPGLEDVWRDVWRRWVWSYMRAPESETADALKLDIDKSLSQALVLWSQSPSWKVMADAWSGYLRKIPSSTVPDGFILEHLPIEDRIGLAKFLAYVGLGQWSKARKEAESLGSKPHAAFWMAVLDFARDGRIPERPLGSESVGFFKAEAFLSDVLPTQPELVAEHWRIKEPILPAWSSFSEQLAAVKPAQALDIIERESRSLLLSPDTTQILRQMAMGYVILLGDPKKVREAWSSLDMIGLPVSLKLAGLLVLGKDAPVPESIGVGPELAEAAGLTASNFIQAPFWLSVDEKSRDAALKAWPLDELLLLGYLKRAWRDAPSPDLAKRMGLLFPETPSGMEAILSLAEESGRSGLLGLSATYLAMVEVQRLSPRARAAYLHSKARLELELGRTDKALGTYEELLALDRNRLNATQKLQLALLAQQRGRLAMAEELLGDLWTQRADLEPSMQAEILFYQAEVAHSLGNLGEALDNYLKLAYLYPEQNIWAVTAMYRAALLYESAGRYESARLLLGTVIKNADRKSQKEAAGERLKAVESKLATEQRNTDGRLYPF